MYQGNTFPKGLEITTETKIRIFDQDLIDKYYTKFKQFFIVLMKQIVSFCDKTEQKTQNSIHETKTSLKQQLKGVDFEEITNAITSNKTTTKQLLHQV